ncbi:predicted GPI-anchored protein 58, partial [Chiloscyllium plagiosum]|uniref:predicted GPI-anchored protein 58 n=1 Tax=Chiloscyllium plagiosum TaxID=36176 RepID=UPI001CB83696
RSDSPDSLLKLKLESPVYETFERVAVPPGKTGRGKTAQYETHLGCLESIRRGADGRFVVGPEPEISPNPAPPGPGPCPQVQQVQARPPLRPKARGQAWARPRACYFAVGTSSPADESQPPPSPDISPIAPGSRPAAPQQAPTPPDAPAPGTGRGSLFELGPVAIGDRGPGRVSPLPGPSSRPGHPQRVCNQASGSRTLLREPSMSLCPLSVPSETTASSLGPSSSGYHSGEASWLLREDRNSNKRGAPAEGRSDLDAGLAMSSEILDALRVYQRARRPHSSIVLHDLTLTGQYPREAGPPLTPPHRSP